MQPNLPAVRFLLLPNCACKRRLVFEELKRESQEVAYALLVHHIQVVDICKRLKRTLEDLCVTVVTHNSHTRFHHLILNL